MRIVSIVAVTVLFAACAAPGAPPDVAPSGAGGAVFTFEDVAGVLPPGWQVAETNGKGMLATWVVAVDADANGGRHVLRLSQTANSGQTYNVLVLPGRYADDLELSVAVRADSGKEDQGGGVLWRARDAENYYIARWNPLENNVRAYKVVAGKRTMLGSADVDAGPGWHELRVEVRGDRIRLSFGGKRLLHLVDLTFAEGGRIGLWTKADAATSFDDLEVSWAR